MPKKTKQDSPSLSAGGVNLTEVERLLTFMQSHGLEEFEYQDGNFHIRLKKASSGAPPVATYSQAPVVHPVVHAPQPPAPPVHVPVAAQPPSPPELAEAEDLHIVKSPIVGTFYSSPSPDGEPFVSAGSRIEAGQVLCIIEAMKLMNEIESDVAGELVRVFAQNGQPVEYGEPLFGIRAR